VAGGDWLLGQGGIALTPEPGIVDAAVLGISNGGLYGRGIVAQVQFRVLGAGDPHIVITSVDARDSRNRRLEVPIAGDGSRPDEGAPRVTALLPNVPNPFNPTTRISFTLATPSLVDLRIFAADGRLVRALLHENRLPGRYEMTWDGTDERGRRLSSGAYYARLKTQDGVRSRVMMLVK
jgi:hypothetical protein